MLTSANDVLLQPLVPLRGFDDIYPLLGVKILKIAQKRVWMGIFQLNQQILKIQYLSQIKPDHHVTGRKNVAHPVGRRRRSKMAIR